MSELSEKNCLPGKENAQPLQIQDAKKLLRGLKNWGIIEKHHISKTFFFSDYKQALQFVLAIADVAEQEQHHPNISFTYGKVQVDVWTHTLDGLTENDFILASKIDQIKK